MKKIAWVTLLVCFVAGCSIAQPFARVDYYQFDYPTPAPQSQPALEAIVGVRRFGIASAYDHDRLVQKEKDLRAIQSYYYRWVTNPRMMLSELLMRDLLSTGGFKAVVMMPANLSADYEINGFIQEMIKDDSGKESVVRIVVDVTLQEAHRIVFQKKYSSEKKCQDSKPSTVAKAMSAAYQEISAAIQSDVYQGIKNIK